MCKKNQLKSSAGHASQD